MSIDILKTLKLASLKQFTFENCKLIVSLYKDKKLTISIVICQPQSKYVAKKNATEMIEKTTLTEKAPNKLYSMSTI